MSQLAFSPTSLLLAAIESSRGVVVSTTDIEVLKRKLYKARNDARVAGNYSYDSLTFRIDPRSPKTTMLILKKETPDGEKER